MKIAIRFFVLLFLLLPTVRVLALSPAQKEVFDSGAEYFNIEQDACGNTSGGISATTGNTVYMIGDSLTVGMRNETLGVENTLQTQFANNGWNPVINAHGCRPVWYPNTTQQVSAAAGACATEASIVTSAFKELENDKAIIASASAVIVALGTNKPETNDAEFKLKSLEYIDKVRELNPGLAEKIYWVNLYSRDSALESRNTIINEIVAEKGIKLIDYRAVATDETVYPFQDANQSQVHLNNTGYVNKAKFIADALGASSAVAANPNPGTGGSGYDPLSLGFPAFPNESETATQLTKYLRDHHASSPWFTIDQNIGEWLFTESKSRGINPLLIASIGKQENSFGGGTSSHVVAYYNYFGMKGSSPIDIAGSEYRGFASAREGILFFMDTVKTNTQGPDKGLYVNVTNFYEYLGMHQSGIIAYPGEPLDAADRAGPGDRPDGDTQNGWDNSMQVYTSWDTTKNDGPPTAEKYRGNTYNPGIYYKNSVGFINSLSGLTISDVPVRGGGGAIVQCVSGVAGGTGAINSEGYSFPLAPQTKFVGGVTVGQTTTRHHDNTAAFDLFSTDSADVYAIYAGVATNIQTNFKGIDGCSTIQFKANDGFYYWYGHMKNVTITEDTPVNAGDKIGQIADDRDFGSDCWGGGPHLHIDRGCVIDGEPQTGGRDECRDPDFIPFLASIYERLSE